MPIVTFSKPVAFPIAAVRMMLSEHLPLFSWQCGEDDTGAEKEMGAFLPHILITGRSASALIFVELRAVSERLDEPAPPHEWHLSIAEPTTDLKTIADRIKLAICQAVMFMDEAGASCRLYPGGNWLRVEELFKVFKLVFGGEDLAIADGVGIPAAHFAGGDAAARAAPPPAAPPSAPSVKAGPDVVKRMLSPMVLLLDRKQSPNWWQIEEFARKLDPEGGWSYNCGAGLDLLLGRGTRIIIEDKPEPVPDYVYEEAFARSFWYAGDRSLVERHSRHVTVGCALDTGAADWVTTRQVAKVVTMVTGVLARLPGAVAVHNLTVGTIFEAGMAGDFLSILGRDQLPVPLWTFTAPHSLRDRDICLSTSGLTPFLGHEIEVWNAPLTRDEVQDKVSNLIIYLLDRGPVIGHGDSAGYVAGDKSIRCFLGPGRAEREQPVQALFLEFGDPKVAQPKPDLPASDGAMSPDEADRLSSEMIDEALQSAMSSASPMMRRIFGDIRQERSGKRSDEPAPPASPPAPPSAAPDAPTPGFGRRAGGFGRKGL